MEAIYRLCMVANSRRSPRYSMSHMLGAEPVSRPLYRYWFTFSKLDGMTERNTGSMITPYENNDSMIVHLQSSQSDLQLQLYSCGEEVPKLRKHILLHPIRSLGGGDIRLRIEFGAHLSLYFRRQLPSPPLTEKMLRVQFSGLVCCAMPREISPPAHEHDGQCPNAARWNCV